jgi:voltage-gated potassium channel
VNARAERWQRRFEVPILVAALLVIPVIAVEESSLGRPWTTIAAAVNWAIWLAFLVEVVVMLAVVPDRKRWLRDNPLEVAIVVLTPPFLPASLQALRVFRLLRLLRLAVVVRYARRLFTIDGLRYAALLALITALGGGAAFAAAEDVDIFDGVWWAVTTMSTVGYGDLTPETTVGRLVAMFAMVVGIGFLSLLIGAVSERFVSASVEDEVVAVEQGVEEDVERRAGRSPRGNPRHRRPPAGRRSAARPRRSLGREFSASSPTSLLTAAASRRRRERWPLSSAVGMSYQSSVRLRPAANRFARYEGARPTRAPK